MKYMFPAELGKSFAVTVYMKSLVLLIIGFKQLLAPLLLRTTFLFLLRPVPVTPAGTLLSGLVGEKGLK